MAEVIGIRFKEAGKVYFFDPDGNKLKKGDGVIVETVRGIECGEVALDNRQIDDGELLRPLRKLLRVATEEDLRITAENKAKEKEAFEIFQEKIESRGLKMKLLDVQYTLDGSKVLFYFSAEGRVDFRELVKDLAGVFKTRIELRQIGVRDEAKALGGLGLCGRKLCCSEFLGDFQPVSIKMAKEQGVSLNPAKISGTCGRLMCCLKYEQDNYEHLLKITPKPGAIVETAEGAGTVVDMSLLSGKLKVRLHNNPDSQPKYFLRKDVKLVRDSKIKLEKEEIEALKDIEG